MRWVVELPAPAGGTAASITVEADSWAGALTRGRGGTSVKKFRCEFEEDGVVRVHDLDTRERYTVRPVRPPSDRSSPAITAPAPDLSLASPAPVEVPVAMAPTPVRVEPPVVEALAVPEPPPPETVPTVPPPADEPRVEAVTAVPAPVEAPPAEPPVAAPPAESPALVNGVGAAHISEAPGSSASIPPTAPSPQATLLFERDQDPGTDNPLVYRERVFSVPAGTTRAQAEELARQALAAVRRTLGAFDRGRYVMVAVFDHEFASHPARPPLAVLQWKDWRGEPEVSHPATLAIATDPVVANSFPAPAFASTATDSVMPDVAVPGSVLLTADEAVGARTAEPPSVSQVPVAVVPEAAVPVSAAPAPETAPAPPTEPAVETTILASAAASAVDPAAAASREATLPTPPTTADRDRDGGRGRTGRKRRKSSSDRMSTETARALSQESAKVDEPPVDASLPAPAPVAAPVEQTPPVAASIEPPVSIPSVVVSDSMTHDIAEAVVPAAPAPADAVPMPAPVSPRRSRNSVSDGGRPTFNLRKRGNDLLSDLFDAVIDLAFLQEAQEACDFTARILRDIVVSDAGVVHLYDIDRDELVVVSADGAPSLKDQREKVKEGVRGRCVLRHGPIATDASEGPVTEGVPAGPTLCVPVSYNQRLFAVLELRRKVGRDAYATDEQDAVVYVATQLGEFLSQHSRRVAIREHSTPARR